VYQETVEKARTDNQRIVGEAKTGILECEKALCRLNTMERDITTTRDHVARGITQVGEGGKEDNHRLFCPVH
jgi:hypothetical protein